MEKNTNSAEITDNIMLITEGMQNLKARNITVMDLRDIDSAVCDYFLICEGNSNTQVKAIANGIEKNVREISDDKPWHVEGLENADWVLMDYVHVVVHIFQPETRKFYDLEGLWNDALITNLDNT